MNGKRPVKVILLDQAKDEFEELNRLVGEQRPSGRWWTWYSRWAGTVRYRWTHCAL